MADAWGMGDAPTVTDRIREVLREHVRLAADVQILPEGADLFQAGMTSHASVGLMLALEDEFDLEFPDHLLKRSVFESISAIRAALAELDGETAAA